MKKFLVLSMFIAAFITYCNAQDVKVNINNQDATVQDDCVYRINGICSSEDIGGVNVDVDGGNGNCLRFKNYNGFTVTVLYECVYYNPVTNSSYWKDTICGVIVLEAKGEKSVNLTGDSRYWSVKGIIVRKLS